MEREQFAERVYALRQEGKSIRTIARELGTYKTKIQRALKDMAEDPRSGVPARQRIAGTFVGRQREMVELRATLEDVSSGRARIVMLSGDPGIGKTRTAQEFALYATSRGAGSLWGRCYEGQGAPPYWPWIQIIRSCIQNQNPEQIRSTLGSGAANIAEVVPEVREALPDLEPPPRLEPEQARFRLFDSITTYLKNISKDYPLVLLMDNLHWADTSSLLLLEFLSQEISDARIFIIGTYRDIEVTQQHPLSHTLGELIKHPHFQRISLGGLDHENIRDLMKPISGITPSEALIEAVYRQTGGNPLFVTEVVRMLAQEGALAQQPVEGLGGRNLRIPHGAREAIGRRLHRLSHDCYRFLTVASVVGREFSLELMKRLTPDLVRERLVETLDEGLFAHIIEEMPDVVGRYQFTHVMIQETFSQELSSAQRAQLHGEIGGALEALYGSGLEAHAAELAHHFAEAQTALGTAKLIIYSSLAGERALATYAYEEALAHIQRGLAAKEVPLTGSQPAQDLQEADLLFGLVRAQVVTLEFHELHEAVVTIGRAFEYYTASGETDRAVAVAEVPFIGPPGERTGVAGLLARALALVPPDSHQAGRLLSRYSRVLAMEEGDDEESRKAFDGAMAIARQEGDTALEMRTLAIGAETDMNYFRRHDGLEKALRALGLARDADDPTGELTARLFAVFALRDTGNPEEAERHASAMLDVAERFKDRSRVAFALHGKESINRFQGNWDAARSYSDRGLVSGSLTPMFHGARAHLEYEIGDSGQGDINSEKFLEIIRGIPLGPGLLHAQAALVIPLVGRIIGRLNDADLARQTAEAVISSPYATPAFTGMARAGLALLETLEGHISEIGKHYEALKVWRGETIHFVALSGDRLLGILAQAMGETDQAVANFEDALAFCHKAGYRPELAWTCCDYADLLLERAQFARPEPVEPRAGSQQDRTKAKSLLDESLAISSELGMRPLVERVKERLGQVRAKPGTAPAYPDGLSHREVEVLRLITLGKTNREIGEELFITARTVANHVTNLLNKTDTANRTEAASYATRHELV